MEGYYARPGEDGAVTLTGMDAHAWAEVYFEGLGWIPFDATNGGPGAGSAGADGSEYGYGTNSPDEQPQTTVSPFDDGDLLDDELCNAIAALDDNVGLGVKVDCTDLELATVMGVD